VVAIILVLEQIIFVVVMAKEATSVQTQQVLIVVVNVVTFVDLMKTQP